MTWRTDLENAPTEEAVIVGVNRAGGTFVGQGVKTRADGWVLHDTGCYITPTHWQPLPDPPPSVEQPRFDDLPSALRKRLNEHLSALVAEQETWLLTEIQKRVNGGSR